MMQLADMPSRACMHTQRFALTAQQALAAVPGEKLCLPGVTVDETVLKTSPTSLKLWQMSAM